MIVCDLCKLCIHDKVCAKDKRNATKCRCDDYLYAQDYLMWKEKLSMLTARCRGDAVVDALKRKQYASIVIMNVCDSLK